jgi:hypothetical protein
VFFTQKTAVWDKIMSITYIGCPEHTRLTKIVEKIDKIRHYNIDNDFGIFILVYTPYAYIKTIGDFFLSFSILNSNVANPFPIQSDS